MCAAQDKTSSRAVRRQRGEINQVAAAIYMSPTPPSAARRKEPRLCALVARLLFLSLLHDELQAWKNLVYELLAVYVRERENRMIDRIEFAQRLAPFCARGCQQKSRVTSVCVCVCVRARAGEFESLADCASSGALYSPRLPL